MPEAGTCRTIAHDCPCTNTNCAIWGDCVACVSGHRTARAHLPECMQDIIRDMIADLAAKVEFSVTDERPAEKKRRAGE